MNRFAKGCTLDRGRHRYTPLHIARARGIVTSAPATSHDLSQFTPQVMDQTEFGCCEGTSSSGATYTRFEARNEPLGWIPSQVGIYVPALCIDRASPDQPLQDVGTETNSVVRVFAEFGIRPMGPSPAGLFCDVTRENVNAEPNLLDLEQSATRLTIGAYQITSTGQQRLQDIRDCVASGIPVRVDSFVDMRFEEWTPSQTPIGVPDYSDPQGGGHALYLIAFTGDTFVVRNSWGTSWGDGGNILVNAAWIEQCDAFAWDVRKVAA